MKFRVGDKAEITLECSIKGWTGIVYKITEGDHIHCHWDNNSSSGWMHAHDMRIITAFRKGDVIKIGKRVVNVDGTKRFNESKATLISRKNLI